MIPNFRIQMTLYDRFAGMLKRNQLCSDAVLQGLPAAMATAAMTELDLITKKATALKATLDLHAGNKESPGYKDSSATIEKLYQKEVRGLKRGLAAAKGPSAKKQAIDDLCLLRSQDLNLKWEPLWDVEAGFKQTIQWLRAQFDEGVFLTPPCGRDGCSPKESLHGGPAPVGRFRVQAADAKGAAPCRIFAAAGNPEFPEDLSYTDAVSEDAVTDAAADEGEEGDDAKDAVFKAMEPIFTAWGKTNGEIDELTADEVESELLSSGSMKKVAAALVVKVAADVGCPAEYRTKDGKLRWLLAAAGILEEEEEDA